MAVVSAQDKPPLLIVYDEREAVWKSWARDCFSFGWLIAAAFVLNRYMPPSGWLNAALAISWILWLAGKGLKRRMEKTPAEAIAWIREQFPQAESAS